MAIQPVRLINSTNRELNQIQRNVNDGLKGIQNSPFNQGQLVTYKTTQAYSANTDITVTHNLGHAYSYFLPFATPVAGLVISQSPTQNSNTAKNFIMRGNASIPSGTTLAFLVY
jgi:hypothetical protein